MKLATIATDSGTAAAVVGDEVRELPVPDVGTLLAQPAWEALLEESGRALTEPRFLPVVPRPSKIICVGLNFKQHILEMGRDLPTHPSLFAKFPSTLLGPFDDLVLPGESESVDWEAELGVVVGRPLRRATAVEARAAIAGFTVLNDVTARDWQKRTPQWFQGKNFEATTPVGPCLVTPDELGDISQLRITCEVNGELMQDAQLGDLVFGPADVLAYCSEFTTLQPGDLIALGTPGGVGAARSPQRFLQPGDELRTSIEGIGTLVNRCSDRRDHPDGSDKTEESRP